MLVSTSSTLTAEDLKQIRTVVEEQWCVPSSTVRGTTRWRGALPTSRSRALMIEARRVSLLVITIVHDALASTFSR